MMSITCSWTMTQSGLCRNGVSRSILVGKRFRKDTEMKGTPTMDKKLRLQAYYYGFSETGVRSIDLVLRAVSAAGKLFHHTDQWTSEVDYPVEDVRGSSPVDWIQNAADDAAVDLATTQAALEAKTAECERLRQDCQRLDSAFKKLQAERSRPTEFWKNTNPRQG